MKSRDERARTRPGLDAHARDGVSALIGLAVVVVAAFGACNLDDKNPPLPNEAPNRGQFVGGIAIGAGPGPTGTGGSGAGLGTGGSSSGGSSAGGSPPNCACGVSYSDLSTGCSDCFTTSGLCTTEEATCNGDPNCPTLFSNLSSCGGNLTCVRNALEMGATNAAFEGLLQCGCLNCGPTGGALCSGGTTC